MALSEHRRGYTGHFVSSILHRAIIWASSSFRDHPIDVLRRIFNITRFAMYAVLRVDLKLFATVLFLNDFVNTRGAVTLSRFIVKW